MCSINHDLKAIFIHVHKTGGTYISYMLHKYYGFTNYYLRRPDHDIFCMNKQKSTKYLNYENRLHGVLAYYKTSTHINKKMNMTPQKWDSYYKFCFIRNPYDKIVSAWNHVNLLGASFEEYLYLDKKCNDVEYMHVFLPQVRNIINQSGKIKIDYIGKFENLEEDFQNILKNIGIKNIIHDVSKQMNKRNHNKFYEYYNQRVLTKVNEILSEDFALLDYPKIDNINIFYDTFIDKENLKSTDNNGIEYIMKDIINNVVCDNEDIVISSNENEYIINNVIMDNENEVIVSCNENEVIVSCNDNENEVVCFNNKIVMIYAYYEKNNKYMYNFKYFLEHGILDYIDYYIVINGVCNVDIPIRNNIKVLYRENIGFDFGAYSHAISTIISVYDYYFFMNTSVIGPYSEHKDWINNFIDLFNNENVKIVGTSINIYSKNNVGPYNLNYIYKHKAPYNHVQTMFFGITRDYLDYLKKINFFNEEVINKMNMNYIIAFKEIGLSQHALSNGWNINCILDKYMNLDYRILNKDINNYSRNGDPYYMNSYYGSNIKKEDVIFFKINRFV